MIALFLLLFVACGDVDAPTDPVADAVQLYTCGMHPQVVQEGPGSCPICGMDLVPMSSSRASGVVRIDPVVVQNMGVRTEVAKRQTVFRHLRTIGEVEVGEDELAVVNLRYSGWVEELYVDRTGDPVKAGQALFEVYSPELVAAQEDYLLALRTQGADSDLAQSARRKLELWDLRKSDLDRIRDSGEVRRTLPVRSPQAGFVLHKNVVEGARVTAGKDLYRIGNLQRVWVTAEVYEFDAPWVEVGQPAQMELTYDKGQVLEGEVSYIYPTLNEKSRTLTVRLEFENTGLELKPGMFATVYIEYRRLDDVIAVPSEAILHSGTREIVFVTRGGGHFEPREVTTGLVGDHSMTEVLDGLAEGDEVVVSGQFLIDSESQLQEALRKMMSGAPAVEEEEAGSGQYTCPMHPEVVSDEPGRCPECGMFLEEVP